MTLGIDWQQVSSKFAKAAIFGSLAGLVSVNVQSFSLNSLQDYQKLAVAVGTAVVAGVLHSLWNLGEQVLLDQTDTLPSQPTVTGPNGPDTSTISQ